MNSPLKTFKATTRLILSVFFAIILLFYWSCKPQENSNPNSFIPYINAYSSGIISKTSSIKIDLVEDLGITHSLKTPIDPGILSSDELLKGETSWTGIHTLEFKPSENLLAGKTYHFHFNLGKLLKVPDSLKSFAFSIHTLKPNFEFESEGLKSYHGQKGRMIYEGNLTTADSENPSKVEEMLGIQLNGEKSRVSWSHTQNNHLHHFFVDSLIRKEKPASLLVSLNGQPIGKDSSIRQSYFLPGINEFKILETRVLQDSEQAVIIQFSDPLSKTQDLRGLLELGDLNDLRFSIEGSEVKIYSATPLDGNYIFHAQNGIKNQEEKKLGKVYSSTIYIENRSPSVLFPGNGVILPSTGKLLVPFLATNLKAIDVKIIKIYTQNIPQFLQTENLRLASADEYGNSDELRRVGRPIAQKTIRLDEDKSLNLHHKNRFFLDLDKMIRTEPGAIYRILIAFKRSYAVNVCKGDSTSSASNKNGLEPGMDEADDIGSGLNSNPNADGDGKFWNFYNSGYGEGGEYDWSNRENPCSNAFYTKRRWASRNILASNLGIIVKKEDHDHLFVSINDLLTTEPLSGVSLEVHDFQQQVIASGNSDSKGECNLNPIRKPFLLVAKRGLERGYLKLADENALSLSRFDIGGDEIQNGLKGFIYQERDVHRPGDSLFFSFILDDSQNKLPELFPVNFELRNPTGQLIKKATITQSIDKFYVFRTKTDLDAPTGIWNISVKLGGNNFNQEVRIETIMPNRLKINLDFGGLDQLSAAEHPTANLNARWLFGGIASKLNSTVDMTLRPDGATSFPHFTDYVFDDPTVQFEARTQTVFQGNLNDNGSVRIPLDLNLGTHPPGKLRAQFFTKVFEPGGAFSIHQTSIPFVFYSSFVGLKTPKGDDFNGGMLLTGKDHLLDIVQLDEKGNLLTQSGQVELALYKLGWHWWWENSNSVDAGFLQAKTTQLIKSQILDLNQGKSQWSFRVEEKNWGRYLVLVKDLKSGHVTGKVLYIESPDWVSRAMDANPTEAAMLSLNLDKPKYQVGETVQVKLPSAKGGRCLISIESGTKTIKTYWIKTEAGQTHFSFPATEEMSPNVYVHATLLQGAGHKNDLPIRMYGVVPLFVENKETILKPKILVAESLKPESPASLTVSETDGKEMTYTLALVDEGLLDLTGFETPDPHKAFYAREALGVKTFDLYDDVLGAWEGMVERILSIGGDENLTADKKSKKDPTNQVNRFKPVVIYLGPFHLNRNEKRTHHLQIPQFIGALRVMVIAGHDKAYGSAETSVKIKKPLMMLATLPRVLAPEETLDLPVTVFGMEPAIKTASISIDPSEYFELAGPNTQTVNFPKPGDQLTSFGLKIKNKTGVAKVTLRARSGKETAQVTISLAVRNPNSYITQIFPLELESEKSGFLHYSSLGAPDQSTGYMEVSTIPALNLQKRLSYLIDYPNGCAEQVTSAAFPQLFISALSDLNPRQKADIDFNIKTAIRKLALYQSSGGGINYWPGAFDSDEWASSYSGHFYLEAQKKGYLLPEGFLSSWKRYQRNLALAWYPRKDNFYGGDLMQAYRLYTLALAHAPEIGAMNRLLEFKYLSDAARWRLASAYALIGNKETARHLIENRSLETKPYRQSYYTYGSDLRDQAMKLETLTLIGDRERGRKVLNSVANALSEDLWYSTQETAFSLISIAEFCGSNPSENRIHYRYSTGKTSQEISTASYISTIAIPYSVQGSDLSFENLTKNHLYIRVIEKGKPDIKSAPEPQNDSHKLVLKIRYTNLSGEVISPENLIQGTDFMALVNIKNTGNSGTYYNMALSEIFPSGWEILNSRLIQSPAPASSQSKEVPTLPTYQDIRDDRVLTYFNLSQNETANFFVYLNATYRGHFYAPGIYCEAMYDASIHASSSSHWINIVSPEK